MIDVLSVIHVTGDTIDARIPLFVMLEELPGHAGVKKLKNDCGRYIGKHFVAKDATAPANVPASNIVREEDLLWQVRVIKPRDGIHSFTLDPDRLTLVLSDDGRIVDAACN